MIESKKSKTGGVSGEMIERLKKGDRKALIPMKKDVKATPKTLTLDPGKCNGCGLCEIACSLFKTGEADPARSRIHILEWDREGVFLPVCCQHCADAPCKKACPKEAVYWNDDWGRVMIDYDRCVSCRTCVAACPFGALGFDAPRRVVFKCDLCGGNPQCVHFCEPKALAFLDAHRLQSQNVREAARKLRRY